MKIGTQKAEITVHFDVANKVLVERLEYGKQYTTKQIKQVLADSFEGITIHQISSFITRSCKLETGVLWKEGKLHTLRSTVQIPNNVIELANYIVEDAFKRSGGSSNYIEQTKMNKQILLEAVQKIDNIPAFQIQTIEEYNELCRIRESLVGMIVHK